MGCPKLMSGKDGKYIATSSSMRDIKMLFSKAIAERSPTTERREINSVVRDVVPRKIRTCVSIQPPPTGSPALACHQRSSCRRMRKGASRPHACQQLLYNNRIVFQNYFPSTSHSLARLLLYFDLRPLTPFPFPRACIRLAVVSRCTNFVAERDRIPRRSPRPGIEKLQDG
jgi:hypothetical protein